MSSQPENDSFPIRSQKTNPTLRRGAQPGNTNALRHGRYSERFNPRQLHSRLAHTMSDGSITNKVSDGEGAGSDGSITNSGSDQNPTHQVNLNTPLTQHLNILQAVIQDLAQTAADGEGTAVPLLLQAIRIHATLTTLSHTLQNTSTPTHYRPTSPEAHSQCKNCGDWWKNYHLTPEGLCIRCSGE